MGLAYKNLTDDVRTRPCGRNPYGIDFWDSFAESGVIHRLPSESEAERHVDENG
jgi:hypothetical protein